MQLGGCTPVREAEENILVEKKLHERTVKTKQ